MPQNGEGEKPGWMTQVDGHAGGGGSWWDSIPSGPGLDPSPRPRKIYFSPTQTSASDDTGGLGPGPSLLSTPQLGLAFSQLGSISLGGGHFRGGEWRVKKIVGEKLGRKK